MIIFAPWELIVMINHTYIYVNIPAYSSLGSTSDEDGRLKSRAVFIEPISPTRNGSSLLFISSLSKSFSSQSNSSTNPRMPRQPVNILHPLNMLWSSAISTASYVFMKKSTIIPEDQTRSYDAQGPMEARAAKLRISKERESV